MADLDQTDADLIDRAKTGDEPAFEALMRRYSETIRRLIARYFRNRFMVDDLAQETFVKAYFRLNSFRNDAPFIYWLKKIAVRLCLDEMRRRKTQTAGQEGYAGSIPPGTAAEDPGRKVESQLMLDGILATLGPMDRMIVVLLYGEGYDVKEIAGLTGMSQANIKVRAFRIRRRLKALYAGGPL